jgi:uncharacterized membrane protein
MAILELFHLPLKFFRSYKFFYDKETNKIWSWVWFGYSGASIQNILETIISHSSIFLSIERTIACLLPTRFYLIDRKRVFVTVYVVIVIYICSAFIPKLFRYTIIEDPLIPGSYKRIDSDWGKSDIFRIHSKIFDTLFFALGFIGIASMILSVVGMLKARWSRYVQYSSFLDFGIV